MWNIWGVLVTINATHSPMMLIWNIYVALIDKLFECCSKATCIILFDFSKIMAMHIKYFTVCSVRQWMEKKKYSTLNCVT